MQKKYSAIQTAMVIHSKKNSQVFEWQGLFGFQKKIFSHSKGYLCSF